MPNTKKEWVLLNQLLQDIFTLQLETKEIILQQQHSQITLSNKICFLAYTNFVESALLLGLRHSATFAVSPAVRCFPLDGAELAASGERLDSISQRPKFAILPDFAWFATNETQRLYRNQHSEFLL